MCCAVFLPLCPRSANCTGLSSSALLRKSAGHSCPIPRIIYTHCTTPTIFCFQKQKSLLAASKLSGAIILNVHVKSERQQCAPADVQPPPHKLRQIHTARQKKRFPQCRPKTVTTATLQQNGTRGTRHICTQPGAGRRRCGSSLSASRRPTATPHQPTAHASCTAITINAILCESKFQH